jgi:hypothetical protein
MPYAPCPSADSPIRRSADRPTGQTVTDQVERVQGFRNEEVAGVKIVAGPNRPCGRMAKTISIVLVDFLNPEL